MQVLLWLFAYLSLGAKAVHDSSSWAWMRGGQGENLGHGETSAAFHGVNNLYIASGDPLGELLHILLSLRNTSLLEMDNFVSVVGSFEAMQLLVAIQPKQIVFFDENPAAIAMAKMKLELLEIASSPQEYITRIFARDVRKFEQTHSKLTSSNQEAFMAMGINEEIRRNTEELLTPDSAKVYKAVIVPHQAPSFAEPSWFSDGRLRPCNVRSIMTACTASGFGPQPQHPGDRLIGFRYGEGFLTNQHTYNILVHKIKTIPISWVQGVDFPASNPMFGRPASGDKTVVFVMDMFASKFASEWKLPKQQLWFDAVGKEAFVLIQTIVEDRNQLVQQFNGSVWSSLSDWDSSPLMPALICARLNTFWQTCCSEIPSNVSKAHLPIQGNHRIIEEMYIRYGQAVTLPSIIETIGHLLLKISIFTGVPLVGVCLYGSFDRSVRHLQSVQHERK